MALTMVWTQAKTGMTLGLMNTKQRVITAHADLAEGFILQMILSISPWLSSLQNYPIYAK